LRKLAGERRKDKNGNNKKEMKKKKLRTTGVGEEGGKKRIVSWRLGGPLPPCLLSLSAFLSPLSLFLSSTLLLFISVPHLVVLFSRR